MKIKFIAVAIAALTIMGCESYLDKAPLDSNSDATNWTSESALEIYAWSLYNNFSGFGSSWTRGQYHSESMSDDYAAEDYTQPTQNIASSNSTWSASYIEIRRANILLARVDLVPGLSEEAANHWRGIARFFRAQQYFDLVKTFGDCVWVDAEANIDDEEFLHQPRMDRAQVMKNVCEDLVFAGENCRFTTNNTVNNMCAWALLSRVALFEGAWQKYHKNNAEQAKYFYGMAKTAANNIIESNKYAIHDNYIKNYISKDLKGNSEIILFEIYSRVSEGAKVDKAHAMQGYAISSTPTWGMTKSAIENFVFADGTPIHMGTYDDSSIESVFSNRDARLSDVCNPEVLCVQGHVYTSEGINSTTGYYTDKFVDWDDFGKETWNGPYNTADAPIYTYGEVLLNYAEACAEIEDLGGSAMSQADLEKSVNILRANHGKIPALTYTGKGKVAVNGIEITADPKNTAGVSNLLWELRRERRSELMCDGFRYEDILRWKQGYLLDFSKNPDGYRGVSVAALEAFGADMSEVTKLCFLDKDGKYISAYNLDKVFRTFDEGKHYLEPIPSGQLTLHPELGQNPGW